jgi:hypothetical protein
MRKLISLGLFALMLSIFSSQVFAGKIAVCEDIKNDPAYKGLYGLCNAYWNADDAVAQAQIKANFEKKARTADGGPGMPGWETEEFDNVTCPCWDFDILEQYVASSCLSPAFSYPDPTDDQSEFDLAVFQNLSISVEVWAGYTIMVPDEAHECWINLPMGDGKVPYKATSADEDAACRLDVLDLIAEPPLDSECVL